MDTPLLISRTNPNGMKLEDLIDKLIVEIRDKNVALSDAAINALAENTAAGQERADAIAFAVDNNVTIIRYLHNCAGIQMLTSLRLAKLGEDNLVIDTP